MKSRFENKNQDSPIERGGDYEDYDGYDSNVEVDDDATGVASNKGSKVMIIIASAILITVVLYFFFIRGEKLTEDSQIDGLKEISAEDEEANSKGPDAEDLIEDLFEDDYGEGDTLYIPETPKLPKLPELPELEGIKKDVIAKVEDGKGLLPDFIPLTPRADPLPPPVETRVVKSVEKVVEKKEEPPKIDPRKSPMIVASGGSGPTLGIGYENNIINLNQNPIDQLRESKSQITPTVLTNKANTVAQGKMMTAVLETAINTEIPGVIRGILSRDVYGEAGFKVLIPKGSRLYGSYSSNILRGQGRVEITWNRLIRTDGVDIAITFNAADQFGRAGLEGDVDNKYGATVANAFLTSILAVGTAIAAEKISGGDATTTTTTPEGSVTTTGKASDQVIADVSTTIVDMVGKAASSALVDLTPVIRIPQGTKMTIIVNADLQLPPLRESR